MFNGFATKWKIVSLEFQATKVDLPIASEKYFSRSWIKLLAWTE